MVERADFVSAQCQHKTASSGTLALSSCVLRASTCHLFGRSYARAAPRTRRAHVCLPQDGLYMLPYYQQFCKIFPASSPPAWQRSWAAWRPLSPTSLARLRRWLQTACRTPRRPSVRRPLLHVTRTYPPTQRSTAHTWWTPRSVSLLDIHPCTRRHPPHVLAKAAVYLGATDGFTVIIPEPTGVVRSVWRVPTGETPSYLRERHPRTYGRDKPRQNLVYISGYLSRPSNWCNALTIKAGPPASRPLNYPYV